MPTNTRYFAHKLKRSRGIHGRGPEVAAPRATRGCSAGSAGLTVLRHGRRERRIISKIAHAFQQQTDLEFRFHSMMIQKYRFIIRFLSVLLLSFSTRFNTFPCHVRGFRTVLSPWHERRRRVAERRTKDGAEPPLPLFWVQKKSATTEVMTLVYPLTSLQKITAFGEKSFVGYKNSSQIEMSLATR